MEIRVYVANLKKYGEGVIEGKWLTLPMDSDELTKEIEKLGEEYAVTSYEAPFYIEELTNIHELNEQLNELEIVGKHLNEREMQALLEWVDNVDEAVSLLRQDRVRFYDTKTEYPQWEDLAELLVYEHDYMSDVPEHRRDYLDFEKIGRDLHCMGNWYLSKNGIAVEEIY